MSNFYDTTTYVDVEVRNAGPSERQRHFVIEILVFYKVVKKKMKKEKAGAQKVFAIPVIVTYSIISYTKSKN